MNIILEKKREIVLVVAFLVIIFVVVYLAIFPLMRKIESTNNEIQQEKIKQEIVRKNLEELPRIQEQYKKLQASNDLSEVLLNKDKAVVLIEKLEKLAQQTDNLISIEVQDTAVVDPKKAAAKNKAATETILINELPSSEYLQLKIKLTGKYSSIVGFMKSLENFEYYCDIVGIQLSKEKSDQSKSLQSVADFGVTSPFAQGSASKSATKPGRVATDGLNASFDVFFYTKNNI